MPPAAGLAREFLLRGCGGGSHPAPAWALTAGTAEMLNWGLAQLQSIALRAGVLWQLLPCTAAEQPQQQHRPGFGAASLLEGRQISTLSRSQAEHDTGEAVKAQGCWNQSSSPKEDGVESCCSCTALGEHHEMPCSSAYCSKMLAGESLCHWTQPQISW